MDKGEIMVDIPEMERQRKKSIIDNARYVQLEIIVGKNEEIPIAQMETHNITSKEIAILLGATDEVKKGLIKRDPMAYEIYKNMDFRSTTYEAN